MSTKTPSERTGVRERILDAALAILGESGIQRLTQPEVARRAGVRQSHLTYYFPTRDDLLAAATARGVEQLAAGLGRLAGGAEANVARLLGSLAGSIGERAHMRMFLAMVVEADGDAAVRAIMNRGTQQMEAAVAAALGNPADSETARLVLAAIWGLGLYQFLVRPGSRVDPTRAYLTWLTAAASPQSRRRRAARKSKS